MTTPILTSVLPLPRLHKVSRISDNCQNEGKHEGTGHYWMCRRCRAGRVKGCADYKPKAQSNKPLKPTA